MKNHHDLLVLRKCFHICNEGSLGSFPLLILSLLILFITRAAYADIFISEVLYDPLMTESGGEAVELYNSGNDAVDISGYAIVTASSSSNKVVLPHAVIPADGFYLVADSSWDEKKDSPAWPRADFEKAMTILNSDSGILLRDADNDTVDRLGWGDRSKINPEFYSINPASPAQNGYSLHRAAFTRDNSKDFVSSVPGFENSRGESKALGANSLDILVKVIDAKSYIINSTLDFDYEDNVLLNPGDVREVKVLVYLEKSFDPDKSYLVFNGSVQPLSCTDHIAYDACEATIPLEYFIPPGAYNISLHFNKSSISVSDTISFQVMPLLAFEVDLSKIDCSVTLNRTCIIPGDYDMRTGDRATIRNTGNNNLDFKVYGSNLTSRSEEFDVKSIRFSFDYGRFYEISNEPVKYDIGLLPGSDSLMPLSFKIDIPLDVKAGNYSTRLYLIGVGDG